MEDVEYIAVVQCHIVKQRCSGYLCDRAFTQRTGGFADYPTDRPIRTLHMTCGGCCGKATLRKLSHLTRQAAKDGIAKDRIVVHLSSCITKDNYHSPRCPHAEYIKQLVARAGLRCREDTVISAKAEERRRQGLYGPVEGR